MSPTRLSRDVIIAIGCAIAVVIIFSSFTLVSRIGVRSTLGVADVAALRFSIGGLLLLPVFLKLRLGGLDLKQAFWLTATGGLGFALSAYSGFALTPAAHGTVFLHGTIPLCTAFLAGIMLAELPSRRGLWGLGLIFVGVGAMAWDSIRGAEPMQLIGDLCLLAASFFWCGYSILVQLYKVAAWHSGSVVAFFAMIIYLPVYALFLDKKLFAADLSDILIQGTYHGVVVGALSILIYTRAVNSLGAAQTALFTAAVPGLTTVAAVPILNEIPSPLAVVGLAVVTVGMVTAIHASMTRATTSR
jgi:drug/metabolite transporter (DMT)-like permease